MRIIGGNLKGQKIFFPQGNETRPLRDLVKESIFNIINNSNKFQIQIEKSIVLDLFSGTGSFGLECISRGANKVTFIEQNKNALEILNKNLINLSINNQSLIIKGEIEKIILATKLKTFNVFFLDPPFADHKFVKILDIIKKKRMYKKKNIVIIHREKKSNEPLKEFIEIKLIKNYGRSKIIFGSFK